MLFTSWNFSSCRYQWDDTIWTCDWSDFTWCQLLSPNLHESTLPFQMHEDYVDLIFRCWKFQETFAFQTYLNSKMKWKLSILFCGTLHEVVIKCLKSLLIHAFPCDKSAISSVFLIIVKIINPVYSCFLSFFFHFKIPGIGLTIYELIAVLAII